MTIGRLLAAMISSQVGSSAERTTLPPSFTTTGLRSSATARSLSPITIETIFSWPGLGLLTFDAINDKDYPVLQGTFLIFSAGVILANFLADCLYFYLDPRVQSK